MKPRNAGEVFEDRSGKTGRKSYWQNSVDINHFVPLVTDSHQDMGRRIGTTIKLNLTPSYGSYAR